MKIGVMSKKEAEAKKREILRRIDEGDWTDEEGRITVNQFIETWLKQRQTNLAAKTHERYASLAERHVLPVVGTMQLDKIKPQHIQEVYSRMRKDGFAAQTCLHVHRLLHNAFGYARKNLRIVRENVMDRVEAPKVKRRELEAIRPEQVRLLIDAARESRLQGPIMLAALTGLRRGEVLALRWANIDLEQGWLFVSEALEQTKTHGVRFKAPKSNSSRRRIPLSSSLIQMLTAHRESQAEQSKALGLAYTDNDLVFCNADGSPWPPDTLSMQFRALADSVGLRQYRLHDLRHAFATLTLSNGTPLKEVTVLMGHSTPSLTLSTYTRSVEGLGRQAVQGLERMLLPAQEAVPTG